MDPGGGKTNQHIPHTDGRTVHQLGVVGKTNAESGEIVFAVAVHVGHFGRFAAKQRASRLFAALCNAGDHLCGPVHIQPAGGEIIKEKERTRPLHKDVVGAHGHEIDADGIMLVKRERQLELGAHPIGGSHQHRRFHPGKIRFEQAAETADIGQDAVDLRLRN